MTESQPNSRIIHINLCNPLECHAIEKALSVHQDLQLQFNDTFNPELICDVNILPSRKLSGIPREVLLRCHFPIITFGSLEQIRLSLAFGVNDFVLYPFSGEELVARIYKNSLRSFCFEDENFFNFSYSYMFYQGRTVPITKTEFLYLTFFVNAGGNVISREMLTSIAPKKVSESSRALDMSVSKLRNKLKQLLEIEEEIIIADRGFGYRMIKLFKPQLRK